MPNLTQVGISSGVPNSGTGTVSTLDALMADGGQATLGAKADAKSTATDTTAVSAISIWKQISASIQAAAASLAGTLTVATHGITAAASAIADGALVTLGAKTDAKSTATDGTSVSAMSVWKQISASLQTIQSTASLSFYGGFALGAPSNYGTSPGAVTVPGVNAFVTNTPNVAIADGANTTFGAKTDAKSTATDATSVSAMQVFKQISASVQALVTGTVLAAGSAIIGKVSAVDSAGNDATDTTNHAIKVNVVAGGAGGGAVTAVSGAFVSGAIADGGLVTLGAKTDAKSSATDSTSITAMQVFKQISASVQALVTGTVLAAGSAIIGKISAVDSAGTDATDTTNHAIRVNVVAGGAGGGAVTVADGANVTLGSKADAKSTATDATAITAMSVFKQISASIQAAAASLAGTLSVGTHAVTQSGTWTVQPGNTPNTTAWKVDGSAVTQPASIADGSLATLGAKTDAKSTATDATSITAMQVFKQISASVQALVTGTVLAAGTAIVGLFKITDGTNTMAVKAASTAPVATDPAAVVAISPNSWDTGSGTGGSKTQRVIIDSSQATANGQATMANSQPSVIASDQAALVTCSTSVTRPADTNAYTANDVWADSTSAPTSGGFTLTNAGGLSGGSGVISDIMFTSSAVPGTLLQGELHIFNQAATAVNDNAAWNLSDADALNRIAVVPFTLTADANNSFLHVQNLNIGFTCSGSANLRFLVKVKNAYTPASGEVLTVVAKCIRSN